MEQDKGPTSIFIPVCNDSEDALMGFYTSLDGATKAATRKAIEWWKDLEAGEMPPSVDELFDFLESNEFAVIEAPIGAPFWWRSKDGMPDGFTSHTVAGTKACEDELLATIHAIEEES